MPDPLQLALADFAPDPDALLRAIGPIVTDADLEAMSVQDFGCQAKDYLAALRAIRDTATVPTPSIPWIPREVCLLTRYLPPDSFSPEHAPARSDAERTDHRRRAFACAILLRTAFGDFEEFLERDGAHSAAALTASALALGPPFIAHARAALAAGAASVPAHWPDRLLLALGVAVCSVADGADPTDGPKLLRLANAIIAEESRLRNELAHRTGPWLRALTSSETREDLWRSLVHHHVAEPRRPLPPEADEPLRLIGAAFA